ncbi:GNAT family N-acetyltransferase [Glycomyces sp. NPDC046736]|uniref:GNAT family N-acetyltransferase n=1 Tax=Glycomyces sp. NPDC046736 TaxID=3155615 RepID=UPI003401CFC3
MSFQTYARRVRDASLPIERRRADLRGAVSSYRRLGYRDTLEYLAAVTGPRPDEAALLAGLDLLERSRNAWLVEMAAFGERRKAQKRVRLPVDPAEVRYRSGPRWPGPDASTAMRGAVARIAERGGLREGAAMPPGLSPAALGAIVEAYLDSGLDAAHRRRVGRVVADALKAQARHSGPWPAWPAGAPWRAVQLIRNDELPLVRRGWVGDAPVLTEVHWAAREQMAYLPALHTFEETTWWMREVVVPQSEIWVAERHGVPVAFAALNGDWLDHLYVAPAAQGRGIGEALLAKVKRRRDTLDLHVFAQNTGARAFYARHGFSVVGEGDGSQNEEGLPDLHLRWRAGRGVR